MLSGSGTDGIGNVAVTVTGWQVSRCPSRIPYKIQVQTRRGNVRCSVYCAVSTAVLGRLYAPNFGVGSCSSFGVVSSVYVWLVTDVDSSSLGVGGISTMLHRATYSSTYRLESPPGKDRLSPSMLYRFDI
jgi:hypothetical protein